MGEEPKEPGGTREWLGIAEACEHLQISEQTMFRWMREGKISYYKVGKSTRFLLEDLNRLVERVVGKPEGEASAARCAVCGNSRLIAGTLSALGEVRFMPQKTKFWVWEDSSVPVSARCCPACGHVQLQADISKLQKLQPADRMPGSPDEQ